MTKRYHSLVLAQDPFDWWTRQQPNLDSQRDRISIMNNDRWVHKYSARNESSVTDDQRQYLDLLMLVEIKPKSTTMPFAQTDTLLWMVDAVLEQATSVEDTKSLLGEILRLRTSLSRLADLLEAPGATRSQMLTEVHNALIKDIRKIQRTRHRRHIGIREMRPGSRNAMRYVRWYGAHVLQYSGLCPACSDKIRWDQKEISKEQLILILNFDLNPRDPRKSIDTRRHHRAVQKQLPLFKVIK
jgi:hypothetical protein